MKKLEMKRLGPVVVLTPTTSILGDDPAEELREAIRQLDAEDNRYLVINLERVELMLTLAYQFMLEARQLYQARAASIRLCSLREKVLALAVVIGLVRVFEVYGTEAEAIASFAGEDRSVDSVSARES